MTWLHKQKPPINSTMDEVEGAVRFLMTELRVALFKRPVIVLLFGVRIRYNSSYVLLPYLFDHLCGKIRPSIVICVSPSMYLIMDQS